MEVQASTRNTQKGTSSALIRMSSWAGFAGRLLSISSTGSLRRRCLRPLKAAAAVTDHSTLFLATPWDLRIEQWISRRQSGFRKASCSAVYSWRGWPKPDDRLIFRFPALREAYRSHPQTASFGNLSVSLPQWRHLSAVSDARKTGLVNVLNTIQGTYTHAQLIIRVR